MRAVRICERGAKPVPDRSHPTDVDFRTDIDAALALRSRSTGTTLDWRDAHARGRQAMAQLARERRFDIFAEGEMRYVDSLAIYTYSVRSSLGPAGAGTTIYIDAIDGSLLGSELPTGAAAGNTITTWLQLLHTGHVFGLPYRILVSATGTAVVVLSVTGVVIWLRRRSGGGGKKTGPVQNFLKRERRYPPSNKIPH